MCRADGGERKSGEWGVGTRSLAQDWALDQGYVHLGAAGGRGTGAGVVSMFEAWTLTGPGCSLWRRVRGQDWPSDRRFFGYRVPHSVGDSERDLLDASERTGDCLPQPALAGLPACLSACLSAHQVPAV